MLRYVPLVQERVGDRLTLGVFSNMVTLCEHSFPSLRVIGTEGDISDCTHQLPTMSLPYVFKTSWENLPPRTPYLTADATIPKSDRYRIGLCWAGSKTHPRDKARSMRMDDILPLFKSDVEWINLQVGDNAKDWIVGAYSDPIAEAQGTDYLETAGLIASCDLVITVDTSVAHLAGALGVPVWMLVSRFPDVRWMLARADTVWYRDLQIFRQTVAGDWTELVHIVKQLLDCKVQLRDKGL